MADETENVGVPGSKKSFAVFIAIILAIGASLYLWLSGFEGQGVAFRQAAAGTIFAAAVVGTLMFWRFRVAIAFLGVVVLLATKTITIGKMVEFMSLDVIIFLVGMMVVVGMLEDVGFFKFVSAKIIKLSGSEPRRAIAIVLLLAALMSALVDEVTCILFISMMVIDMCDHIKANPVNLVIASVFATNIGSSWTVFGNPVGVLIALRGGLTFESFIRWAFPVGFVSLLAIIAISLFWLKKDIKTWKGNVEKGAHYEINEWAEVKSRRDLKIGAVIFVALLAFISMHKRLESALGLEPNTLLVASSILFAGFVLIWKREKAKEYVDKKVDWWTLVFFMFLFAKAGALHYVGLTDVFADKFLGIAGGNIVVLIAVVLFISTFASSIMDNVVLVATIIPIIQSLSARINAFPFWWAVFFGGCYGGNITMVGSTANIVALGVLEKRKGYFMSFKKWIWIGLVAGVVPALIALVMLVIQLPLMK